jgi:hypothetical protein
MASLTPQINADMSYAHGASGMIAATSTSVSSATNLGNLDRSKPRTLRLASDEDFYFQLRSYSTGVSAPSSLTSQKWRFSAGVHYFNPDHATYATYFASGLGQVLTFTIDTAGSGHAVDDIITFDGDGDVTSFLQLKVTAVNGSGGVTGFDRILSATGAGYTATDELDQTSTTGSGTGVEITVDTLISGYEIAMMVQNVSATIGVFPVGYVS